MLILYEVITSTGSLANIDVRVWRLQSIPSPHPTATTFLTDCIQHGPPDPTTRAHPSTTATSLGYLCSPNPCPQFPCPIPHYYQLRIKNERMTHSKPRSDVPRVCVRILLLPAPSYQRIPLLDDRVALVF